MERSTRHPSTRAFEEKLAELAPKQYVALDILTEHKAAQILAILEVERATCIVHGVSLHHLKNIVFARLATTTICSIEVRESDFLIKEHRGPKNEWPGSEQMAQTSADAIGLLAGAVATALVRSRSI
jgi:hypothetical protein